MSGALNTNIPLGFRPTPNTGPDFGGAIAEAARLTQLRQVQQQEAKGNALQNIMGRPGAVDAMGQPTPETMEAVMGVDMNAGLALKRAQMVNQEHVLRQDMLKSDAFGKKMNIIGDTYGPIVQAYEEALKKGAPQTQAAADAQNSLREANERFQSGGLFTPDELKKMPVQFDPIQLRNMIAGTKQHQDWVKSQQTERRLDEQEKRDQRNYEKSGVAIGVDADNRPYFMRPNAPAGQKLVYDDDTPVPREKQTGTTRLGAGGGSAGGMNQLRAETIKQISGEKEWANKSKGEIGLEALRRIRAAGTPVGITDDPETIAYAAEYFKRTGQMPFGMGGKEDREAVLKHLAHGGEPKPEAQPGTPTAPAPGTPGQSGQVIPAPTQASKVSDALVGTAEYKADMNSLRRIQQQRDSIAGYERGASKEFDLAVSLIPKTPEPLNMQLLTQWVRTGARQFNNVQNGQFYVALTSALDEYAKVISGATGSAAASTDSARNQALSLIPPGSSTDYVKGLVDTIKKGMDNRRAGYDEQIGEIKTRIRGPTSGTAPPAPPAPAAPAQVTGTGGPWKGQPIPAKAIEDLRKAPGTAAAFDEHFQSPGLAASILGAKGATGYPDPSGKIIPGPSPGATQAPNPNPAAPVVVHSSSTTTPPAAPTTEGTAQPKSFAVPEKRAADPDGTTYNNGTYVKRDGRIVPAQPSPPADEGVSLSRARAAIERGADPAKVKQMLKDAGIDPAKLDRVTR